MVVVKLRVSDDNLEFKKWLEQLKGFGFTYEVVIESGDIQRVYVREDDNGDWSNIIYGRIYGSKHTSFKQRVFQPRVVNNKLIIDYNE
jgi:hypothetical protein